MLRVGLTGDLGSGKSTVARMFAQRGAFIFSSDEMARQMMQSGQPVYAAIVKAFGNSVIAADGQLNRRELARLAFNEGRAEELNAIVHPAVLLEQARQIESLSHTQPDAIAIVESALIFSTKHGLEGQPWSDRFDRIILVTAPEAQKIQRFTQRIAGDCTLSPTEQTALEQDARRRLSLQAVTAAHAAECLIIVNDDGLVKLKQQVDAVWSELRTQQTL